MSPNPQPYFPMEACPATKVTAPVIWPLTKPSLAIMATLERCRRVRWGTAVSETLGAAPLRNSLAKTVVPRAMAAF